MKQLKQPEANRTEVKQLKQPEANQAEVKQLKQPEANQAEVKPPAAGQAEAEHLVRNLAEKKNRKESRPVGKNPKEA